MKTPERVCHHFAKGDNFYRQVIASLVFEIFRRLGLLLQKDSASRGRLFRLSVASICNHEKGGKYIHVRVISFGGVSIPFENPETSRLSYLS